MYSIVSGTEINTALIVVVGLMPLVVKSIILNIFEDTISSCS